MSRSVMSPGPGLGPGLGPSLGPGLGPDLGLGLGPGLGLGLPSTAAYALQLVGFMMGPHSWQLADLEGLH